MVGSFAIFLGVWVLVTVKAAAWAYDCDHQGCDDPAVVATPAPAGD